MKKGVIVLVIAILLIGLTVGIIYAKKGVNYGGSTSGSNAPASTSSKDSGDYTKTSKDSDKKTEDVHTFIDEGGNEIQIITSTETKTRYEGTSQKIKIRGIETVSDLELEEDKGKIKAKLSNGIKAEIKIMPNTASMIALSRLRSQNRTLELKEVGKGNDLSVVYVSEANKTTKFLGLFKVKYRLTAKINSQTGKATKLDKPWWYFLATEDLEESEIENMSLQLIKPIQDIVIIKDTEETLDLNDYFFNAESYSISEIENISSVLDESILTLTPEINYTGTTSAIITAYKENETLEALFNIIVSEENLSIETMQYPAVLWEKVKWEKKIKAEKQKIKLEFPKQSENIILMELDKDENIIGQRIIVEKFIEIKINESVDSYEIEYYTPAPYAMEESITKTRKKITIIGPENIHYTDVLAFNYLTTEATPEIVKLYQIKENGREEVEIDKYDLNGNGFIDYIEWVVPSLSNQTYELIIEIKGAEHLDSDRNFISDIYEKVYKLDDVWSETIPTGDYVRVIFEQELDNTRDITLYPRIVSGSPRIEVYEVDGTEIIAEFTNIQSNEYNKVYLTNLQATQDTFDLLILDGSLEIDYIVDPAVVSLDSPANDTHSNNPTQIFTCSATDDIMLANITLYGSWGGWHANETKDITGTSNSTTFTKTLEDGAYIWNCLVVDNDSNSAWYPNNYTLTIDTILPSINIIYPENTSYTINVSELNYTYTETNPSSCWYSLNGGANSTPDASCSNFTGLTSTEGSNTWTVYINDTTGNENLSSVSFTIDTIEPTISFSCDETSVYVGDTITCSCSAIDNIDSSPSVSYTVNPSTSSEGEFSTTCTSTDNMDNSATSSIDYTVASTGAIGIPPYWKMTYILTDEQFEKGYTKEMGIKERMKVKIENKEHYLGVIDLKETRVTIDVSSTPQIAILNIGDEKKFEVTDDNYYDLLVTINSIADNKASITIISIHEEIPEEEIIEKKKIEKSYWWVWMILVITAMLIIIFIKRKKLKKYFKKK